MIGRLFTGAGVAAGLALVLCWSPALAAWERGTASADTLALGAGDDRYRAGAGADRVRGGPGDDRLLGQAGGDRLVGGSGRDRLAGGPGRDVCVVDRRDPPPRGCEVVKPAPPGAPPAAPQAPAEGQAAPPSDAYLNRNWQPTAYDSCPKSLHDRYSVVGPDGKLYPGWHPPTAVDPATGATCTFGHEHGADPRGSDLFGWAVGRLAAPGFEDRAGIPFGSANEALIDYAAANPGVATRFEDHVGHKVFVANDVTLLDQSGDTLPSAPGGGPPLACDYLLKLHQGSHSADATTNNVHELLYAVRCNDGTELLSVTLSRIGAPDRFNRSCAPGTAVDAGAGSPYPAGGGTRLIPDRACVEQHVLVPPSDPSAYSDIWALYENWRSENELVGADGRVLARFDPWFAVRNPSRYQVPGGPPGRTLDAAWETDSADGGTANRPPWTNVAGLGPFEYRDPRSPFDGAGRDFYLGETSLANAGGPDRWYTDPYGRNAAAEPFPGSICQLVASKETTYPALRRRLLDRDRDYGGDGVHAPN